MKKLLLSILLTTFALNVSNGQSVSGANININNINALINADGTLFCDNAFNQRFEVPKGSGKGTIYVSNLWIGGVDNGGSLHVAAQTYRQTGSDFFPGPIDPTVTYGTAYFNQWNRVWKINQCDIDAYASWIIGGSVGPNPVDSATMDVITNWPAFNTDGSPIAPFTDINSNGIYEPGIGDTPRIKGDQAIFFVYNDMAAAHGETSALPLGIEVQAMVYAYSCPNDSALYNTIFSSYKIINKSTTKYDSVFIGNWTDLDIGFSGDDFIQCDVTRGAYAAFNGDNMDGPSFQPYYGATPPAEAIVFLKTPLADSTGIDEPASYTANGTNYGNGIIDDERLGMKKFITYYNNFTATGNPVTPADYYNYLNGFWKDNTQLTYGGTGHLSGGVACDYIFPSNTDPLGYGTGMAPQPAWDEMMMMNMPGDRRGMGISGPFTFKAGQMQEIDFAYVYGRATSGTNISSINTLSVRVDSIIQKYNSVIAGCGCDNLSSVNSIQKQDLKFTLYPNPSKEKLNINFSDVFKNTSLAIYDVTGRLIKTIDKITTNNLTVDISDLQQGMYLISLQTEGSITTKRFIKQ